jgi:outer membrane cobalamin receptor
MKNFIFAVFFLLGGFAFAQPPIEEENRELDSLFRQNIDESDQISVFDRTKAQSGSKTDEYQGESPAIVTVIMAQEIQMYGANTLVDVINRITGMYITGSFAYRQNNAVIRGDRLSHFNSHVLILIDGRPVRESLFSGLDMAVLNSFPIDAIERIEVLRGPGSVLYGTGAFTGIIHLITKNASAIKTKTSVWGGSFGSLGSSMTIGRAVNGLETMASIQYFGQQGWDFRAKDEADTLRTHKFGQRALGANFSLKYKNFTARAYYGHHFTDIMGSIAAWSSALSFQPDKVFQTRGFIDLGYQKQITKYWRSEINFTYNAMKLDPFFLVFSRPVKAKSNDYLLEIANYIRVNKKINFILGALGNQVTGEAIGNYGLPTNAIPGYVLNQRVEIAAPYNAYRWAAYLQAEYQMLSWLKLIGGLQGNKTPEVDLDIVPRLGAIFKSPNEAWGAKVLWGNAFRNPAYLELTANTPNVVIGNRSLKPEKVETFDAQIFYQFTNYLFSISYFNSLQNNLIARDGLTYANRDRLTIEGGEVEAKINLFSNKLQLTASYAYQYNRQDNRIFTLDSQTVTKTLGNVTFMPNHIAKFGIGLTPYPGISLGVFNSFFSQPNATFRDNEFLVIKQNNPRPESFNLLSVNLDISLTKFRNKDTSKGDFVINFYGTNLLNENVHDPEIMRRNINSIPAMAGRGLFGGLKVKF